MVQYKNSKFVKTAILPKDYPSKKAPSGELLPEIAVAGRSNVGKSSLLNHLFQNKKLVKTSSTPGKTQALNFFSVDETYLFVDLPGYGYAEVPLSVRKKWGPMVQTYLEEREPLKLLLFLFDIRRVPNDDDHQLLAWAEFHQIPTILVMTKVDKVKKNELKKNTQTILNALGIEMREHLHYSVTKNIGRRELISAISRAMKEES